jgi:phosphate transport system permease protein
MTLRRAKDWLFWAGCGLAAAAIAAPALSVLVSVFHQAAPALSWRLFTHKTNAGGLQNAILGTLLLLLGVLVIAGTVGVGAGIYLAEYATGRTERVLRFYSEVLAGMPSILIGYVAYVTLVVQFHWGYSLLAGILALSALVLPYVVKTTETSLRQVPTALREAAAGLGMPPRAILTRILLPPAIPGVVSGLIIALAISTGELAPLLFTIGFTDDNPSTHLFHAQVPYLTDVVYTNLSLPGEQAHRMSAAAGAVTLIILLVLILLSRLITRRAVRATRRMSV